MSLPRQLHARGGERQGQARAPQQLDVELRIRKGNGIACTGDRDGTEPTGRKVARELVALELVALRQLGAAIPIGHRLARKRAAALAERGIKEKGPRRRSHPATRRVRLDNCGMRPRRRSC